TDFLREIANPTQPFSDSRKTKPICRNPLLRRDLFRLRPRRHKLLLNAKPPGRRKNFLRKANTGIYRRRMYPNARQPFATASRTRMRARTGKTGKTGREKQEDTGAKNRKAGT